jgi:hypothetical protein
LLVIMLFWVPHYVFIPTVKEIETMFTPSWIRNAFGREVPLCVVNFDCTEFRTDGSGDLLFSSVKFSSKDGYPTLKVGFMTTAGIGEHHLRFTIWCSPLYGGNATEPSPLDAFPSMQLGGRTLTFNMLALFL